MNLLGSKESLEAYNRFVKRLEDDERLSKILDDNKLAAEETLYLPTDEHGTFKTITIRNVLAEHLYSNENYKLWNIEFNVNEYMVRDDYNRIVDLRLHVDCYLHFYVRVKALPNITIDDKLIFNHGIGYFDGVNNNIELMSRVSKHAKFTVESLSELVSYMFAIMHKLLDENEQ
jgi:hypothetical protein